MKQLQEWKECYLWLEINIGKLGCLKKLSEKGPGVHLAVKWINGDGVPQIQISYKKDIQAHNSSVEITKLKEKGTHPNSFIDIEAELLKTIINSFRTAYTVTNERLSYKKLPLINLKKLNGTEAGIIQ